jgi:calcium-dependent protein kinase
LSPSDKNGKHHIDSTRDRLGLQTNNFFDSIEASTKDSLFSGEQKLQRILNFKDFRGFKEIQNIKDRYKIGKVLGEGSFGQVRIAMHRQAEVKCAIKIIRKDKISEHEILEQLMKNELKILEETSHPNVMRIYELLNDDKFYFVVSELIKYGELYDFVVKRGGITEKDVQIIIKQLFMALNYMH